MDDSSANIPASAHGAAEPAARILVVEDDAGIAGLLRQFLQHEGFAVALASDGASMDAELERGRFDLVLLDIMLPGESGLVLCRRVQAHHDARIIMVTALTEAGDRVAGLDSGADDYVCKPFDLGELAARIRAVLRRLPRPVAAADAVLGFAGWTFHPQRRFLRTPAGVRVPLTGAEADLLLAFCRHPEEVLSRERLLLLTRGPVAIAPDRAVDLLVSRLRRKLSVDGVASDAIQTARAGGYRLRHAVTVG